LPDRRTLPSSTVGQRAAWRQSPRGRRRGLERERRRPRRDAGPSIWEHVDDFLGQAVAKNSLSLSALRFWKGSTATDGPLAADAGWVSGRSARDTSAMLAKRAARFFSRHRWITLDRLPGTAGRTSDAGRGASRRMDDVTSADERP
jgi:hypothetical protein